MKFSTSFVALAFVFSKSAFALPLESDGFDIVERYVAESYDLEARGVYDATYEERAFGGDLGTRGLGKTPPRPASPAPSSKPGVSKPKGTSLQISKSPEQCKKLSRMNLSKASPKGTRSLISRTGTGKTITVGGTDYILGDDVSGQGGDTTYKVDEGKFYAKRPKRPENVFQDNLKKEAQYTKQASNALDIGLYVADGKFGDYHWLITAGMEGLPIVDRWGNNPKEFATKDACQKDLEIARGFVKDVQLKLADTAGFYHADSHPANWLVSPSGPIKKAIPIDFGQVLVKDKVLDIGGYLEKQYLYRDEDWEAIQAQCKVCY